LQPESARLTRRKLDHSETASAAPDDAPRRDRLADAADHEPAHCWGHEDDIDAEAHTERVDRPAARNQKPDPMLEGFEQREAEEANQSTLGDDQLEPSTRGWTDVQAHHVVKPSHLKKSRA
jgi:hypothetical protein